MPRPPSCEFFRTLAGHMSAFAAVVVTLGQAARGLALDDRTLKCGIWELARLLTRMSAATLSLCAEHAQQPCLRTAAASSRCRRSEQTRLRQLAYCTIAAILWLAIPRTRRCDSQLRLGSVRDATPDPSVRGVIVRALGRTVHLSPTDGPEGELQQRNPHWI